VTHTKIAATSGGCRTHRTHTFHVAHHCRLRPHRFRPIDTQRIEQFVQICGPTAVIPRNRFEIAGRKAKIACNRGKVGVAQAGQFAQIAAAFAQDHKPVDYLAKIQV
jgi:hypothetical protein